MGKLLCEKNLRDVWCRNEIVRAEIGQIVHTHTHTRVSYSSIDVYIHIFIGICIHIYGKHRAAIPGKEGLE